MNVSYYNSFKTKRARKSPKSSSLTLRTHDGRVIAKVLTDDQGRLYSTKKVLVAKHQLRTPPAFAMDTSALNEAESIGVAYHQLFDPETKQYFCAWHADFRRHGFKVCRGFNPQIGLGLAWWQKRPHPSDFGPMPEPPVVAVQGDLFSQETRVAA